MKALVLLSGGLDSSTCLALAVKEYGADDVIALSLSYGQKHIKEIKAAEAIAQYYDVELMTYDVKDIFKGSECTLLEGNKDVPTESYAAQIQRSNGKPVSTYVPFRNGLFLAVAASMAMSKGCDVIYYGAHKDDAAGNAYPDCSIAFHKAMTEAIEIGSDKAVTICDPFIDKTKADIVKIGTELKVPYQKTWSCYNGTEKPCGKCGTCIDRTKAFELNGLVDPLLEV
jgi:7-cyano-7-deazaguanine synthase